MHLDQEDPPGDLALAIAEIPDDLTREKIDPGNLPANWRDSAPPPQLARFGDEFMQRGEHCLLLVPSVLAPSEHNCLINPARPDYKRIGVREVEPLRYDPRMLRKRRGHGRH